MIEVLVIIWIGLSIISLVGSILISFLCLIDWGNSADNILMILVSMAGVITFGLTSIPLFICQIVILIKERTNKKEEYDN